ncbi:MAG: acyl-CoA dehydrogenase family protein [Desulfatibacillaceae bacterium]
MNQSRYEPVVAEIRRFARREVEPGALDADLASDRTFTRSVWDRAGSLDLPGLLVPEEYGGAGEDMLLAALTTHALAGCCAGIASVFATHFAACAAVGAAGAWETCAGFAEGPLALVLPDPWQSAPVEIKRRNGRIVLDGTTTLTGNAHLAAAFVVFARDGEDLALILAIPGDNGLAVEPRAHLPGLKVNPFARLGFNGIDLAPERVLAIGDTARRALEQARNTHLGCVAAAATGCARTAMEKSREWAEGRYQFGNVIIHHTEIRRMLGNMETRVACGIAAWTAALAPDAPVVPGARCTASQAKVACTADAEAVATDAVQIHGGYGYMHEYGVEKILRDAKVLRVLGGTEGELLVDMVTPRAPDERA